MILKSYLTSCNLRLILVLFKFTSTIMESRFYSSQTEADSAWETTSGHTEETTISSSFCPLMTWNGSTWNSHSARQIDAELRTSHVQFKIEAGALHPLPGAAKTEDHDPVTPCRTLHSFLWQPQTPSYVAGFQLWRGLFLHCNAKHENSHGLRFILPGQHETNNNSILLKEK